MAAEFEFQARLFSALDAYLSENSTDFDRPRGEEQTASGAADIYLPSTVNEGVVLEVKRADVDPHSYEVIRQGHRYARDKKTSLFATANRHDVFLFRRTESATSITELDRRHYDLRQLSLPEFIDEFLADVVELQRGTRLLSDFDDLIVSRLRSFHTSIYPLYVNIIRGEFDRDPEFRSHLVDWAKSNDYACERPEVEHTFRIVAQQYAYLLMNRIVFYELVREQDVATESGFSLDPIYGGVTLGELDEHLETCFERIISEIDYEAIFRDDSAFFERIPDNEYTRRRLHEFTRSIEQEPLRDITVDVVGQIYQTLIPTDERKELGQFYTPDVIGQILSNWAIQSSDDRFLDPCSGSGSITVEAYKRLEDLNELSHQDIIERITAVDINKFPLHLTALNLATRNIHEPTDELFAYPEDFFDLDPDTKRLARRRLGLRGSVSDSKGEDPAAIGHFDSTAANPPYVRQEHLYPNRDHFREHLKRFGPSSEHPYYDGGEKEIDGRSDLYCYFLTHVTQFLREEGRLAWIVPTKWMVADYGPSLQQFLFDHYKVKAVVGFRKRVFEDALVDTVLLFMEKCADPTARRETKVNFVRINQPMASEDAVRVIDRDYDIPEGAYMKIQSRPNYRTIAVRQSHLLEHIEDKLHHFINAPALYTAVLEHPDTISLTSITDVTRGKKTGANPVLILDEKDIEARNVETRFLRPAIKSVKEVDGWHHSLADAEKWMLDMHDYVEDVTSMAEFADARNIDEKVLDSLRADGYTGVRSYLQWASNQPASKNASLANYDPWFNMGDLDPKTAPIICPQAMDTRRFFFGTDEDVVASNRFLLVQPRNSDPELLLGLLNSSITKIVVESHGRVTGGGAVNLSSTDLHSLRVVDPDCLDEEQVERIKIGFEKLKSGDTNGVNTIDEILIDVLELDVSVEKLQTIAENLKLVRRRKGQEAALLIQELDALEGQLEMSFRSDRGQQTGFAEFGA